MVDLLLDKSQQGNDSCRIILGCFGSPDGRAKVLAARQWHNGKIKLRLIGGTLHNGEEPRDGARRETFEETTLRMRDLDVPLVFVYTRKGEKYNTHVFAGGFWEAPKGLTPDGDEIISLHWLDLEDILKEGVDFRGPYGLSFQESHIEHLREATINSSSNHLGGIGEVCLNKSLSNTKSAKQD